MASAALGIMCKAPRPGASKTRLAAVIGSDQAAALSACFLRDVAAAVSAVPKALRWRGYGVYAPAGSEPELRAILPPSFELVLQDSANLGIALSTAARQLLAERGHDCLVLINSDSPTLPPTLLVEAIDALRRDGDRVVLGPAIDGGYYLIGLKAEHPELLRGIPWSTPDVFRLTLDRAHEIALEVEALPPWYDIDDAETLGFLEAEIAGRPLAFASPGLIGGAASATRALFAAHTNFRRS